MPKYKSILELSAFSVRRRYCSIPKSNRITPIDSINNNYEEELQSPELSFHDENHTVETEDTATFLKKWTFKYNIQRNAITELLKYLKQNGHPHLPADSRTFFQTPVSRNIVSVTPGNYCHVGIENGLKYVLNSVEVVPPYLMLDFNIDGVPLFRSSKGGFWLILGRVFNLDSKNKNIFVVGVYFGYKKPESFSTYLKPFVNELKTLMVDFFYRDSNIQIRIRSFICDAPARACVTGSKHHNAYFGCNKCIQEGLYINRRMTFPDVVSGLRTNESFRNRLHEDHHNFTSPVEELPINMIEHFPHDYLHCVCLGVVKKLLLMWTSGDTRSLLCSNDVKAINQHLIQINKTQPSEFQRRVRSLCDLGHFKGSEFRTFILYVGPVVLQHVLPPEKYKHFMLLHVAILILCDMTLCTRYNDIAKKLLTAFVEEFGEIYGRDHVVYNVHSLIHLADEVKTYGNLDSFSAFPFESFMFKIKSMIHKNKDSLTELCNRLFEMYSLDKNEKFDLRNYKKPELKIRQKLNDGTEIYRKVIFETFTLSSSERNCYAITCDKKLISFEYARQEGDEIKVYGREYTNKGDFYDVPVLSSNFDIFCCARSSKGPVKIWNYGSIKKKLFAMISNDIIVFFPLLHSTTNQQ